MAYFLKNKPAFLLLLPLFFVLHGFTWNYYTVPLGSSLLLLLIYSLSAVVIACVCWLLYRNIIKASVFAFALMAYEFFFGSIQDTLKLVPVSFISQYRFILPFSLLLFIMIGVWLKRRKSALLTLSSYLNILMLTLIIIDIGGLIKKMRGDENYITINKTMTGHSIPGFCSKPDIYLLLMDQYGGNSTLDKVFHFDNSDFLNELKKHGFYIAENSRSNYNLTPFSMASVLSMNYLEPEMTLKTKLNLSYCYQAIRNSCAIKFLMENGYRFHNYSIFDFPGQPAHKYEAFLPYGIKLMTLNTLTGRIIRDIRYSIAEGKFGSESARKKIVYENLYYNDSTFKLTRNIAAKRENAPKFVYAHFILPHFPYYFDKTGNPSPINKLTDLKGSNSNDYIEYLQYGNNKIMQLINDILTNSTSPPVIMVLSDHGAPHLTKAGEFSNDFVNLNAIYIPGGNYSQFYDSITNVNQFRVVFNTLFDQHLPLLKDSTVNVWD